MREPISSQWAQHLAESTKVTRCGERDVPCLQLDAAFHGVAPKTTEGINHMTRQTSQALGDV